MLNDRWTKVLAAEEYGLDRPTKSYPKRRLLPQFDDEALEPIPQSISLLTNLTDHRVGEIRRLLTPNTSSHHRVVEAKR